MVNGEQFTIHSSCHYEGKARSNTVKLMDCHAHFIRSQWQFTVIPCFTKWTKIFVILNLFQYLKNFVWACMQGWHGIYIFNGKRYHTNQNLYSFHFADFVFCGMTQLTTHHSLLTTQPFYHCEKTIQKFCHSELVSESNKFTSIKRD